jgi:hypothetical protein
MIPSGNIGWRVPPVPAMLAPPEPPPLPEGVTEFSARRPLLEQAAKAVERERRKSAEE